MAKSPKIVVFGAGSVGCFIGGAWHAAGLDVSFIGRESVAADVAEHGIRLSDIDGWKTRLSAGEVAFSTKPAGLARADIVVLCVKSHDTETAARQIAIHAKRKPAVLSFQNGVSNADTLRAVLPRHEVVQGMVPFNVAYLGDGRWHKGTDGDLVVQNKPAAHMLRDLVTAGPARLTLAQDMTSVAWGKLLLNLNNAINALSGQTLLEQLQQRDYRRVLAASMIEALEMLNAAGIEPAKLGPIPPKLLPHAIGAPDFVFKRLLLRVQKIDAKARSSMYDDLKAGRCTDIDYLNGEVVKLAERLGREAPVNLAIVSLVKQAEMGVERTWSPRELMQHVLEGHRRVAIFGY